MFDKKEIALLNDMLEEYENMILAEECWLSEEQFALKEKVKRLAEENEASD